MNIINLTIVRLAVGLLLLILANIALGSMGALVEGTFDWVRFRKGAIRGGIVLLALVAVYFAGYLNPDLLVIDTGGGTTLNLMDAIYALFLAAFTLYAIDVMRKLKTAFTTTIPSEDKPLDADAESLEGGDKE